MNQERVIRLIKYPFSNIAKTLKLYVPLFFIIMLILFILMCVFGVRGNIKSEREKQFDDYAAVAIVDIDSAKSIVPASISEELVENLASPYIIDYYAFSEYRAGSDMMEGIVYTDLKSDISRSKYFEFGSLRGEPKIDMPFILTTYSDVSKSTHFRTDKREIIDGRFAENAYECNIGDELARANGLSVGDNIKIYLYLDKMDVYSKILHVSNKLRYPDAPSPPAHFEFQIVGIYEDNTDILSNELNLVTYKQIGIERPTSAVLYLGIESMVVLEGLEIVTYNLLDDNEEFIIEEISRVQVTQEEADELTSDKIVGIDIFASYDKLSRNNILTSSSIAPNSAYDIGVLYARDQEDVLSYLEEKSGELPEQYVFLDTVDMYRTIQRLFEKTENSFMILLLVSFIIGTIFCSLIIIYVLKDRAYDISVFSLIGMTRIKITALITSEILVISTLAYAAAGWLYHVLFPKIARFVYEWEGNVLINDLNTNITATITASEDILFNARDAEYFASADLSSAFYGFCAVIVFTLIISLFATLFIARHEPMKMMAKR